MAILYHVHELTAAGNIAFLIRHSFDKPDPKRISIPCIDARGTKGEGIGHTISVIYHTKAGDFTVVVHEQVKWSVDVIEGLTKKVDKIILDISKKEGNKVYGDFDAKSK